ncbi:hypothetical protein LINPERHAP1_LOCUS19066 [Linum perenne]
MKSSMSDVSSGRTLPLPTGAFHGLRVRIRSYQDFSARLKVVDGEINLVGADWCSTGKMAIFDFSIPPIELASEL